MATDLLFLSDAYLQEMDAEVTAVDAEGRRLAIDRTVFYATGGGQPHDTGTNSRVDLFVRIIRDLARQGRSVLVVSSEEEELLEIADRVVVFRDGACDGKAIPEAADASNSIFSNWKRRPNTSPAKPAVKPSPCSMRWRRRPAKAS